MRLRSSTTVLIVALLSLMGGAATDARAQGLTGQIGGTVVDSSKGVLPGATVTLKNEATSATATAVTDANGAFLVTNLIAGRYTLTVSLASFKTYEAKGLVLTATERVSLPPITLEVGGVDRDRHRAGRGAEDSDAERRAVGRDHRRADRGHRPARPRLHGHAQGPARRRRHVRPRCARLGIGRQHDHQRPGVVQLLVRRHHEQGHRLEQRQLRGARARLDRAKSSCRRRTSRPSTAAPPARRSSSSPRAAARSSADRRPTSGATRSSTRTRGIGAAAATRTRSSTAQPNPNCQKPQYRYNNTAWTIGGRC